MFLLIMVLVTQGLVEVVTSSDRQISVRATILLGELLHMVLHYFRSVNRAHYLLHFINIYYGAMNLNYVIFHI